MKTTNHIITEVKVINVVAEGLYNLQLKNFIFLADEQILMEPVT